MWQSIIPGALSFLGQMSANDANRDIASDQMAFQERMSNTSYQRAKADMIAAGINPMFLATKGSGASTPVGASIPSQNALSGVFDSVNSGLAAARNKADLEKIKSDTDLNRQLIATSKSQAGLNMNSAFSVLQNARKIMAETDIVRSSIPGAHTERDIDSSKFGSYLRYFNRAASSANEALSILNPLANVMRSFDHGKRVFNTYNSSYHYGGGKR